MHSARLASLVSNPLSNTIRAKDLSRRALLRGAAAGGVAASLGGILRFAPPAAARQATPAAAAPAATHRLNVGQIGVLVISAGMFPGPGSFFAVNAPEAELAEVLSAQGLAPTDPITISVQSLLVETGDQRVLLDTGMGAFGPTPNNLIDALAAEGIAPEEIDIVLLTHMHTDHFGGAIDANGAPAFPNARYLINAVEHEFWTSDPSLDELIVPDEFKAQFVPPILDTLTALQGVIEQIAPGDEIAPGVTAVDARGHTPGHLAVELASDGEGLLHIVDAACAGVPLGASWLVHGRGQLASLVGDVAQDALRPRRGRESARLDLSLPLPWRRPGHEGRDRLALD